ncbi:hypothetical protein WN944_025992 [Citrus x changshan-huyou]|uniref:Uncharacterized protein n=1 Tax=Citrus x changshan-huyou TaxID=2935761 RepID=A0AAP0LQU4_9ROSI
MANLKQKLFMFLALVLLLITATSTLANACHCHPPHGSIDPSNSVSAESSSESKFPTKPTQAETVEDKCKSPPPKPPGHE